MSDDYKRPTVGKPVELPPPPAPPLILISMSELQRQQENNDKRQAAIDRLQAENERLREAGKRIDQEACDPDNWSANGEFVFVDVDAIQAMRDALSPESKQ